MAGLQLGPYKFYHFQETIYTPPKDLSIIALRINRLSLKFNSFQIFLQTVLLSKFLHLY